MMDYPETLEFLYQQLPIFQRIGKAAYKADLSNTISLSEFFGDPHKHFKSIHIAGTNGKGSVAHMMASALQEAGYKVGLHTSPHLKDFRERIKINGEMIPEQAVVEFVERARPIIEEIQPSFFELTVLMAFEHFKDEQVDVAVIETGMGGRLDSTNILDPELSVITNIGLDHTAFLGNDLDSIAGEKAGIIKQNTPVVIGRAQGAVRAVFVNKAQEEKAAIFFAEDSIVPDLETDLRGMRQQENARTAFVGLYLVKGTFPDLSDSNIRSGLRKVLDNTGLQGRWQTLQGTPKVILDIAHNEDSVKALLVNLGKELYTDLHFVLGTVNDKEVDAMLELLPREAEYYFCKADIPRGMDPNVLMQKAQEHGLAGQVYPSVVEAMYAARKTAEADDLILVSGSAFVVAEVL